MKAATKFQIFVKIKDEPEQDGGEVVLYADTYGTLTPADAVAAVRAEVSVDSAGMVSWRGFYIPREVFRGFRAVAVSQWMTEPQIVAAT